LLVFDNFKNQLFIRLDLFPLPPSPGRKGGEKILVFIAPHTWGRDCGEVILHKNKRTTLISGSFN
jgi:hypothetical protein